MKLLRNIWLLERCEGPLSAAQSPSTLRLARQMQHEQLAERRRSHAGGEELLGRPCRHTRNRFIVRAGEDNEELPWERRERLQNLADKEGKDLPFAVYLIASAIVSIAAVGSIFEIINRNAIFGVLPPSNPLWLPILGFFGLTGLPSAGFLFFKAISSANADAERQDKADGY